MLNLFASSMLPMTKSIAKHRVNLNKNVQGPKRRGPRTSGLIRRFSIQHKPGRIPCSFHKDSVVNTMS